MLKAWKERLLITPLPPESWTWKEAALHHLFPVFPADILGLGQAMNYIESGGAQDEHQPNFETWKKGSSLTVPKRTSTAGVGTG